MTSWMALFGSDQLDLPQSIALDNAVEQNAYVAGYTTGGIDGNTNQGNNDIIIARYNRDGAPVWFEQFGTGFADLAHEIEIDDDGKLFIFGETEGSLGGENQGNADPFLVRYDDQGNREFEIQFGTAEQDTGRGIAIDASEDTVFLSGTTFGAIEPGVENPTLGDAWVASHSTVNGDQNWIRQFGSDQQDQALDTAVDGDGNVYVVGFTEGSLEEEIDNQGNTDAWLVKYLPDGTQDWARQLGTSNEDEATSVAVDGNDNIFVSGFTRGDITGEEDDFENEGESDIWVAKYDPVGARQKIIQYGSFGQEVANDLAVNNAGQVYVAGATNGNLLGVVPSIEPYGGNVEAFINVVTVFSNELDTLITDEAEGFSFDDSEIGIDDGIINIPFGWVQASDQARGVAVDNENDIFLTGETFGPSGVFGGTGTFNAGRADGYVTRIGDEFLAQEDEGEPQQVVEPIVENAQFILINDTELPSAEAGESFSTETVRTFQNSPVSFAVNYDVRSEEQESLTGLGLRLHYDSSQITFDSVDELFEDGLINASILPTADEEDFDNNPDTDQFVQFAWADPSNNWPGVGNTPQELFRGNFTTTLEFRGTTEINFTSSSTADRLQLSSQPLEVEIGREAVDPLEEINEKYTFDVDGNDQVDALTDGLQILRNLFGLGVEESAIAPEGDRTTPAEVATYLNLSQRAFDVDGDGNVNPLSDGILISRFAFGITGNQLISGNILGENATRDTPEAIINYIESYVPEVG